MPIPPETRTLLLTVVGYSGELGTAIDSAKGDYSTLLAGLRAAVEDPRLTQEEIANYTHLINYAKMVYVALDIDWWKVQLGESDFTQMDFADLTNYLSDQVSSIPVVESSRIALTAELVEE